MALPQLTAIVGANISGFEKAMGDVSKRLSAIDREANKAFSGFEKIGDRLTSIGTSITAAVSLPLAAAGAAATKFAVDFESEMRKVTSLLGGATQKEFEDLNRKVLEVSRSLGVDATKSAEALYEVISAGVPKDNAIDFLTQASKTAIAGVTDTKVAVDALTTIISAYSLKAEQAKEVSDAMFQAVNVGKFQFEDLAKAIGPAAAQANNLGISYQELLAATSTLSITSGGVSQAVTQVESAMRALLDPTKEMQAALKAVGFETGSAAVKALGFEGTLQALRKQAGGNAEAFNAMFGRVEAASGALGLTGDRASQAAKDYETLKSASAGVGATQKALEEINKSTTRQYEVLSAQLKVTAIELGTALLPAVNDLLIAAKPLVGFIGEMVKSFTQLPQPVQTAAIAAAAAAAAIGPLVLIAGQAIGVFTTLAPAVLSLSQAFLVFNAGPMTTFATVTIPAAVASLRTFALTTIPITITALSALASTMISQAIASVSTFATVTVPAATASLLAFARTAIPATIAGIVTLTTTTLPAAIASLVNFARAGVAGAAAALTSFAATAVPAAISAIQTLALTTLPLLGVAATIAASAFAGFKLGQWAYDQIPGFRALGDAISDTLLKIPGVEAAIFRLTGVTSAQNAANETLTVSTQKLEAALSKKGITVNSAGKSTSEYSKALLDAAKSAGLLGSASDSERAKIDALKKQILESETQSKLTAKAMAELGKGVKEAGEKHKEATGKVRQFLDLFPVLAAKVAIVNGEFSKSVQAIAEYELAVERGEKTTVDFTEGLVTLKDAIPELKTELLNLPPGFDDLKKSMEDSVKPIEKIIDAYHRLGLQTPQELQKTVNANREAWEIIVKDSGSQSVAALEAWIKYEESRQEAARRSGEVIPEEQRKGLDRAQAQLDAALGKQTGTWGKFTQQVSTIINDFAKDLARGTVDLIKNLFDFDGFNKKLREDSQKLRDELAERTAAIDQFQQDIADKIAGVESGYAEKLAQETSELRDALAERTAEYEQYAADVATQLETLRNEEGERLANEIGDLADALRDKEAAYQEYQQEVAGKEAEIRQTHADRLADQLADLRDNLAERQQSYDRFVEDANTSLRRIGEDLNENIDDATRNINRRMEDENTDFARDEQKLNEDIRKAEKKGDKEVAASLRTQLKQRTEDHEKAIRRMKEDLAEQIDDAKKRAQEQTEDLQRNLERRADDHAAYIKENIAAQAEVTKKNQESLDEQLGDLQENLDKRTKELLKFRDDTNEAIAAAGERSRERLKKEENELKTSLDDRKKKLNDYAGDVEKKIGELTDFYARKQAEEVAALNLELSNKLKEYDTYRTGVETKLAELEAAHKGPLDRIRDMFKSVFDSAANAILRVASEEVIGKLIGKLSSLIDVVLPGVGHAIDAALGTLTGSVGGAVGQAAGGATSGAGQAAGIASQAAGAGLTNLVGAIAGVATAVSSIVGNFQMAGMNKTLDLIERYTRYSEIHLSYILEKTNEYLPKLADIQAFNVNRFDPWLTHMKAWTEPGGQWYDRTVQLIDLIAQRVVPPLDQMAMAFSGADGTGGALHVRVYLDGKEISNAITASDESGGGAL